MDSTRRDFLSGALAASGLMLTGLPEVAWPQPPPSTPPKVQPIGEIKSQGDVLRGVITVRSEDRTIPADENANVRQTRTPLRYFEGRDANGNLVWPPANASGPLPGPTLRASVGDRVQLTFLNHIDTEQFGQTGIDNAEKEEQGGCDRLIDQPTQKILYPDLVGDDSTPRNCFHASSTVNLHFHGTHVTPDGLGDNVLLQLRPSPRTRDAQDPRVTRPDVTVESVKEHFRAIFDKQPPARWLDLPEGWRQMQERLLKKYDQTLPAGVQLWPPTEVRIARGLWPQFAIAAYPYYFRLTKYSEDGQGKPDPYRMGQCPGTHWYHAHKHGSTAVNVLNGMAGAFIIEGPDYDGALEKLYPNLKQTQKVLIVQNFAETTNLMRGNLSDEVAGVFAFPSLWVNGQLKPKITMRPGEIQLWRLVNASIRAVTTIQGFAPQNGTAPEIRQIAQDGVQFSFDNYQAQPFLKQPPAATSPANTFAPGNRVDVLVKAPDRVGSWEFTLRDTTRPSPGFDVPILTLEVAGTAGSAMQFPSNRQTYPKFPPFLKDIDSQAIRIRRTLDFGWLPRGHELGGGTEPAPKFTIDDRQFTGDRYDQTMILGDYEEWTLLNTTARIAHPFHIHVNPFQVVEIFDPNAPERHYKPEKNFVWQDVIAIPPAKSDGDTVILDPATGRAREPGYVRIRHPFVDFPGSYVLHCHMLAHEDRGMMQLVRVIRGGEGEDDAVPHH